MNFDIAAKLRRDDLLFWNKENTGTAYSTLYEMFRATRMDIPVERAANRTRWACCECSASGFENELAAQRHWAETHMDVDWFNKHVDMAVAVSDHEVPELLAHVI